jgi:hypothetical protein
MPDAQGTTSFIAEFVKGYMGQMQALEQKRIQDLQNTMTVAENYRKLAEDPNTSPEVHDHYKQLHIETMGEFEKQRNTKVGGLGQVMKLLGFGKKQANGSVATPPSHLYRSGPGGAQTAEPPPSASADYSIPSELSENPPEINQAPGIPPAGTGTPDNKYAGLNEVAIRQLHMADLKRQQEQESSLDTARKTAVINRQFGREDSAWQQEQNQKNIADRLAAYKASPQYGKDKDEDRRMENYIQFQTPYRESTVRTQTKIVPDANGHLVTRTIDLNDGKVITEEPYSSPADEPLIQALMTNNHLSREQAVAEIGNKRLEALDLTNKGKKQGIEAQTQMIELRNLRTEALKKAKAGGLTTKDAIGLAKAATTYGKSVVMSRPESAGMSDEELNAAAMVQAQKWVEEVGLSWQKVQSLINGQPQLSPQEEAHGYKGPSAPSTPTAGGGTSTGSIIPFPR